MSDLEKRITETCSCGASITYPTYPYSVQLGVWREEHRRCGPGRASGSTQRTADAVGKVPRP